MARITITCFGAGGDFFPVIAVGLALRDAGHEVQFAVPPLLAGALIGQRVRVRPIGPRMAKTFGDNRAIHTPRLRGATAWTSYWNDFFVPGLDESVDDLERIVAEGCDLLVAHNYQLAAPIVAAKLGVPWATVNVFPSAVPSAYTSPNPPGLPALPTSVGRAVNRGVWAAWRRYLEPGPSRALATAAARRGVALDDPRILTAGLSPELCLNVFADWYTPVPPDRSGTMECVGYPYWDDVRRPWDRDALEAFAEGGPGPLVVVCLGTFVARNPESFWHHTERAVTEVGGRAIFLGVSPSQYTPHDPSRVLPFDYAPSSSVMGFADAVVHHGGAGVTHAALRAGKPAVAVTRSFDQLYHGRRLAALGAAINVPWQRATPERLRESLHRVLDDRTFVTSARGLRDRIEDDPDPAGLCVERISSLLAKGHQASQRRVHGATGLA